MNYLEWNNIIGKFYFNQEKAEQEVYLFISRHDIIKIGREIGLEGYDEDIFLNYIRAIRGGIPGKKLNGNILEHALYSHKKWMERPLKIDGVPIEYPLYIGYLSLFVLCLTENNQTDLRVDAYYPRLRKFLEKYELPSMPVQNELNNWNPLWANLFDWSFEEKNTELGYFEVHHFRNDRWVYVGRPLTQSVFPIYAIRKLPYFYEVSNLIPGEDLCYNTLKKLLLTNGERYLGLSKKVLNAIRDTNNELGHSIINIVMKNYQEWMGLTDQYDSIRETIKKGNTIAQLRLSLEGDKIKGYKSYFRLYTKLDFPEDLKFQFNDQEYHCLQFGKGWSKPLFIKFNEGIELQDKLNKWKAIFPKKEIRLLVEGKNFHLSGWVEVPYMIASRMLLLAKERHSTSIEEWGGFFAKDDFKKLSKVGIPDGHVLYEICNPPIGHPDIPTLQFKPDKRVLLTGGIKLGVRTWLKDLLPDVELENGNGNEILYLIYENSDEKIPLERKNIDLPVWILPTDISTDRAFYIKVEGIGKVSELKNFILNSNGSLEKLNENILPARDNYGQVISRDENSSFVIGSKLLATDERKLRLRQIHYNKDFRPQVSKGFNQPTASNYLNVHNEHLLTFLTVKGESSAKDYFETFESVYQKSFRPEEIESHSLNLSILKRWSLNHLDFMGFLDYEYSTKKIIVNGPQFILIPTQWGRKVLLIGGRTPELIKQLKTECTNEGLRFISKKQDSSLSSFILPPTITISGFDENSGDEIEKNLRKIAKNCSIYFDPDRLPQFRLAEFSGNIGNYISQLVPDERFDDSGWPARVFDVARLHFVPIDSGDIDKSHALVEYRLTEYSFKHRFWKNNISYDVNKNWARYMILNHYNKEVIFNDRRKNIVAIPETLPLPRLISEAMTLFSGKAPSRKFVDIEGIQTWFIIYENLPHLMAYNTFLKVGQKMKETLIEL